MNQRIEAAKQRVESASGNKLFEGLKPVSIATLSKGSASRKHGKSAGGSLYAFKMKMKSSPEPELIFGTFEGGHPGEGGKFGQLTKSEWNSTFRPLWAHSSNGMVEFIPCQDGTVFFYVYG